MTSQPIVAIVALGLFGLSCVVTWQLVLTLRQARATALALEKFLDGTRPRIEAAGEQISQLVGRADRILSSAEQGRGTAGTILEAVIHGLAGWKSGVEAVSAIAALIGGMVQAWSSFSKTGDAAEPAPEGGIGHE